MKTEKRGAYLARQGLLLRRPDPKAYRPANRKTATALATRPSLIVFNPASRCFSRIGDTQRRR